MKCCQCARPAFYLIGDDKIPLCLDCGHKLEQMQQMQFLRNAAMLNQAMDDMDNVVGFGLSSRSRIPVAEMARAMQKGSTYNNINISNSQVGVLNTGDLARIDAVITLTKDSDAELAGQQLRLLTQAIVDTAEIGG